MEVYDWSKVKAPMTPPRAINIEFAIDIATTSVLSRVTLVVSSCGYTTSNPPIVQFQCSNLITEEVHIRSEFASSSHLYGLENIDKKGTAPWHDRFNFPHPVRCRIIWMTLSL